MMNALVSRKARMSMHVLLTSDMLDQILISPLKRSYEHSVSSMRTPGR